MFCAPSYYGPVAGHCAKQIGFSFTWLLGPLLLMLLVLAWWRRQQWQRHTWSVWAVTVFTFALVLHMRYVDRQSIVERHTTLDLGFAARIALISDLHVGLYTDDGFVARVVERLNAIDVDVVLVAGDWTYEPTRPLPELLAPFAQLRHLTLSVPGNHDEQAPGPPIARPLRDTLLALGIKPIEGTHHRLPRFTVVGLGDHRAHKDDLAPLWKAPRDLPLVVLMHEPDSAVRIPPGLAKVALAGHTHGGQVRLPFIGALVNSSVYPFDRGLHANLAPLPTFVTSGLGESILPIRLLNPPVIDVLIIR
jgi:uncharacterized protein